MDHPAVVAARRLADEVLRPDAPRVDVEGVPRSHLDALATAGLMDVAALPPPAAREVSELLAGADPSTWFVWTQHHTPTRTVARCDDESVRARWLPRLTAGELLAGVAFTHLRRPGPPAVSARPDGDGWVVDGEVAWLTSWAIADVFLVGAQAGDDVVWVLTPLRDRAGASAAPLQLAAMQGTSTVRLRLDALRVTRDEVVLVEPLSTWRAADAIRTVDVSAAIFGVTAEAVRRLRERDDPVAAELADSVQRELDDLRGSAYALMDQAEPGTRVDDRLRVRAAAHALACRATAGLVAAGAGRSMLLDAPAQLLARVALFLLVQGQTAPVREATMRMLVGRTTASGERGGDVG